MNRKLLGDASANYVSTARIFAALAVACVGVHGRSAAYVSFALVVLIWLSDAVDGTIARVASSRAGWDEPRTDGTVLDPLADDAAFIIGFAVLAGARSLPLYFLALIVVSRGAFGIVRSVGLATERGFRGSSPLTKAMGVILGAGQMYFFAELGFPHLLSTSTATHNLIVVAMAAVCLYVTIWFAVVRNGDVLGSLFTRRAPRPDEGPVVRAPVKTEASAQRYSSREADTARESMGPPAGRSRRLARSH